MNNYEKKKRAKQKIVEIELDDEELGLDDEIPLQRKRKQSDNNDVSDDDKPLQKAPAKKNEKPKETPSAPPDKPNKKQKPNPVIKFSIAKPNPFVRILEITKDFAPEVLWVITEKGLQFDALSTDHTSFVTLKLDPEYFHEFDCPQNRSVGIRVGSLFKLLKGVKEETVEFELPIEANSIVVRVIPFSDNDIAKEYELFILDIEKESLNIDDWEAKLTADMLATSWIEIMKECAKFASDSSTNKAAIKAIVDVVTIHLEQEFMTFNFNAESAGRANLRLKHADTPKKGEVMIWGEGNFTELMATRLLGFIKPPSGQFEIGFREPGAPVRFSFPVRNNCGFFYVFIATRHEDSE